MEDSAKNPEEPIEAKTEEIVAEAPNVGTGNPKKSLVRSLGLGVAIAVVVGVLAGGGTLVSMAYSGSKNPLAVKTATLLRLAVARVNDKPILYSDYNRDLGSLKQFYAANPQSAGEITDEQASDQVMSRLIANALIAEVATEFKVETTQEDLEAARKDLLLKFNNDEKKLTDDIRNNFNLNLDQFYTNILYQSVLQEKLAKYFAASTGEQGKEFLTEQIRARHILFEVKEPKEDAKVKITAGKVLKRLKAGEDFAKLAKEFGSDGTKDQGGDLGWFGRGAMVPEFETAAFALGVGELSAELVKTNFGYHIIRVDEKKSIRDFDGYMKNKLKDAKIIMSGNIHNPFEELQIQEAKRLEADNKK
ncbi:MAG: peptidylprolyl isomerase [Patescibacteria group bacterium]